MHLEIDELELQMLHLLEVDTELDEMQVLVI